MVRAHRKPAVVADRLQLRERDARLEREQAAQLTVPVLLDDEVRVVRFEEGAHVGAEWERADAHVVDGDTFPGKRVERLHARRVAAPHGDQTELGPWGEADERRWQGAYRSLDLAVDAVEHLDVLVAILRVLALAVVPGAAREVRPLRVKPR